MPLRRFHVTLKAHNDSFQREVEARDRKGAVAAYKQHMGILATEHKFVVTEAE